MNENSYYFYLTEFWSENLRPMCSYGLKHQHALHIYIINQLYEFSVHHFMFVLTCLIPCTFEG